MSGLADLYRGQLREAAHQARAVVSSDVAELAATLYDRWYAPARPEPPDALAPRDVVAHLRAADAAAGRFERGWSALSPADAAALGPPTSPWQVAAANGKEARWVDPIDLLYEGKVGLRPPPGAPIAVSGRRDSLAEPPGWWTTFGRSWASAEPPLVRLYWSVRPARLFALVEALTARLDSRFPWAFKCPLALERCRRPDALVLYIPTSAWELAGAHLAELYAEVGDQLARDVPALTLELAPGLALAEDPGTVSFGTDRCEIVAEGMWSGLRHPGTTEDELVDAAEEALAARGIRLSAPYLAPDSHVVYEWEAA